MNRFSTVLLSSLLAFAGIGCSGVVASSADPAPVVAPSINKPPVSQTVSAGQAATFSVSATGTHPLAYQWFKNGVAISGATSASYTTPPAAASDSGAQFTVTVSNSLGNVTSDPATLTVSAAAVAPSITAQPASQSVTAGQTATFSVAATGSAPLGYQWMKNGTAILGANSLSYTTPATTSSDNAAQFAVTVTNTAGNVTSNSATLTVSAAAVAPSITTQPANQTVTAGQTASFSVIATGTAPLTYQWKKNGAAISGATSSSYTTPATTSSDSGALFAVTVTNTAGSATSNSATLTVSAAAVAPSVTTQPANQTVTAGQTASFSVIATGTAPLTYQWKKNGTAISGATAATYTTPATTTSDSGAQFTATVTNSAGNVTSNSATLTVNAAAGQLSAVPSTAAFGSVTTGTSNSQTIKLTNSGGSSVSISQANVTGAGFSVSGLTLPATVPAGQSINFNAVFAPTSAGSVTGSISLVSTASNSPLAVALSGTGAAPTLLLGANPTSLSFGSVNVNSNSSLTATVTNNGNSDVKISSVTTNGAAFSASGLSAGTTLTPSQSATLSVTFAPTATGSASGSVTVASNATNSPATITLSGNGASASGGPTVNVKDFGATGNGSTNDTSAIQNAIAALSSGATLVFPCGTYLTTSQLTISRSNITIDGSGCATIRNTSSGTIMVIGGSGNGNPNYGSAVALSSTANELATSFSTTSSLGVSAGDYVRLQQGGKDSSNGSGDTGCDPSGCRGEVLKVASVSGNTITVTTALHDTYSPSVNGATAQKLAGPLTGIAVKNIAFDGNGSNVYGLALAGVAESNVTGVTSKNVQGAALLNRGDFNVGWNNITVTGAGSAQCGSAVWFENQGNLSINGMNISSENQGASGSGCLANGAFGFELIASANSTIANLTVDAAGAYGRPFKTTAARYNTFNAPVVKNGVQAYNGISLEYYSSHNTYNSCVVTNNGAGTGTGTGNAGIITFGNFNQYNSFNNCTVSGNGNVQFYVSGFDALRLAQDHHNTISGGSYTGSNNVEAVILIEGGSMLISGATVAGPGAQGLYLDSQASNSCVNNNTFVPSSSLGSAISVNASGVMGLGNLLNGLTGNLSLGVCSAPLP